MKNVTPILEIKRVPFSRMLKSEVADYAEKTLSLVSNYEIESALINPMWLKLKAKESEIRILRLSYGIDTERLRANRLKADLMLTISALKLKVRMLSKSKLELDVHVIENAINSHLRYLNEVKNDKELAQKISGFLDLVNTNVDLMEAISTFKLNEDIDTMQEAFSMLTLTWQKRVKMLAQRPNTPTRVLVKSLAESVENLFKTIEVASLISPLSIADEEAVDLAPMMEELSKLSEMYQKSISIRTANNKRKANLGKPGEGEGEGDLDGEGNVSTDEPTGDSADKPADENGENGETTVTPTAMKATAMKSSFGEPRSSRFPSNLDENYGQEDNQDYDQEDDDEDHIHA